MISKVGGFKENVLVKEHIAAKVCNNTYNSLTYAKMVDTLF